MGNRVDISEIREFSDELTKTASDIKSSLDSIQAEIDRIIAMESFSGKTAKSAKNYFADLHKTILESFNGLFTDLNDNLKLHVDLFQSDVDSSQSAIVDSDYLTDTEMDVDEKYEKLNGEHVSINRTINNVADISSATSPKFSSVTIRRDDAVEIITDLNDKFIDFTSEGKDHDSQTKELLHNIEVAMKSAGRSSGVNRFADYKTATLYQGIPALKDHNSGTTDEKEKIDELLEEIQLARKAKDKAVKDLDEPLQDILQKAFTDLNNGKIDEGQYYDILSDLKALQNGKNPEKEMSKGFMDFVIERSGEFSGIFAQNTFGSYIEDNITKHGNKVLSRGEVIGLMGSNAPSHGPANSLLKKGKNIIRVGQSVGGILMGASGAITMYDDLHNNNKTPGEATAHTAGLLGAGIVGDALGTGATYGIAALLGSNPGGWAVAGGIALGTLATWGFNKAYENNFLGIQDGLDYVGEKIDEFTNNVHEAVSNVKETASDFMEDVGEAISGTLDAINPFS